MSEEQPRDAQGRYAAASDAAGKASAKANRMDTLNSRSTSKSVAKAHRDAAMAHHQAAKAAKAEGQPQLVVDTHKNIRDDHEARAQKVEDRVVSPAKEKAPAAALGKFADKHARVESEVATGRANSSSAAAKELSKTATGLNTRGAHSEAGYAHMLAKSSHELAAKKAVPGSPVAQYHEKAAAHHDEWAEHHQSILAGPVDGKNMKR